MSTKAILSIALLALLSTLVACDRPAAAPLEGKTWVLQSYGPPEQPRAVLPGKDVTASFDPKEKRVGGTAGCNLYSGGYELKGDELSLGALAATKMYCPDPEGLMAQENGFLALLGAVERWEVKGDALRLLAPDGQVLVFRAR